VADIASGVVDYSGYFSITQPACSIVVVQPASGDELEKGARYNVHWSSENAGDYVRFDLYKSGSWVREVAPSIINDGSGSWTADDFGHGSGSDYRFRITDQSNASCYDYGGNFKIVAWYLQGTCTGTSVVGEIRAEFYTDGLENWRVSYSFYPYLPSIKCTVGVGDSACLGGDGSIDHWAPTPFSWHNGTIEINSPDLTLFICAGFEYGAANGVIKCSSK
jgi:hypothetical protein